MKKSKTPGEIHLPDPTQAFEDHKNNLLALLQYKEIADMFDPEFLEEKKKEVKNWKIK